MILHVHTEIQKTNIQRGIQTHQLFVADDAPAFSVGDLFGFWLHEIRYETLAPVPFGRNCNFPFGAEIITSVENVTLKMINHQHYIFIESEQLNDTAKAKFAQESGFASVQSLFNFFLSTKYNKSPDRNIRLIRYGWNE